MPSPRLDRARIVAIAADLADQRGLDAVTVTEIASRAGVRTASLYTHVDGLQPLLDAVADAAYRELGDILTDALIGRSEADAVFALADAEREYARAHPGRWAAMARRPYDADTVLPAARRVGELVTSALRGYRLAPEERVHAVRAIGAFVNGFITLESQGAFAHSSPAPAETWTRMLAEIDALLHSLSETTGSDFS